MRDLKEIVKNNGKDVKVPFSLRMVSVPIVKNDKNLGTGHYVEYFTKK